jgi:DNA-binding CsgD family transcriptional regulator
MYRVNEGIGPEKERTIKVLSNQGKPTAEIARTVGLSRPTIYKALG